MPCNNLGVLKSVQDDNYARHNNRIHYAALDGIVNEEPKQMHVSDNLSETTGIAYARYCYSSHDLATEAVVKDKLATTELPIIRSTSKGFLVQGSSITDGHRVVSNQRDYF